MIPHPLNRFGFENEPQFLTLTAVETGTVELRATGSPNVSGLHYRLGTFGNWSTYVPGTVLPLQAGKKVQFWNSASTLNSSAGDYVKFIFSGQIKASGNCASMLNFTNQIPYRGLTNLFRDCTGLLTAPELPTLNVAGYGYTGMFRGCTNLVKAPKILPAMDIAAYCYNSMFQDCSSLITVPKLPAMTLKINCYAAMFFSCSSLVKAPELPAMSLADGCYASMLYGTTFTEAPELPATTLANNCYSAMFQNNRSLTSIKIDATTLADNSLKNLCTNDSSLSSVEVNFTDWNAEGNATANWLNGTAASGTFTKPQALSEEIGYGRIPTNWTIINK